MASGEPSSEAVEGLPGQGELEIGGRRVLNADSTDLLGLSADPRVKEAAQAATRRFVHGVLSDRPSPETVRRLREHFPGRLVTRRRNDAVRIHDGNNSTYNKERS